MTLNFAQNTSVRLIGDPSRIGIATGRTRPGFGGVGLRYQVKFPDTTRWIPEDQLECVPNEKEGPIDLLEKGKFGWSEDFRRALTHARLSGKLSEIIYSMDMTNTDFYPYQFKPLLRFLNSPNNALLIADEVGLGKTIEAGLIWTELRVRFGYRRLLVLCPAMLREKWKFELSSKMGVRADIVNAKELHGCLKDTTSSINGFALICSLEGARPSKNWDKNLEKNKKKGSEILAGLLDNMEYQDSLVDLLIVDEAHYLRNPQSQTHQLLQLFRPVVENLLFLTATPIHNRNTDLFSLLNLLDESMYRRESDLERIISASQPLVSARDHLLSADPDREALLDKIKRARQDTLLRDNRQLSFIRHQISDQNDVLNREFRADIAHRLEVINPLFHVVTRTRKREVKEWRVERKPVRELIPMKLCEEEFYHQVTDIVIDYAEERDYSQRFLLATPQRQMSSSMPATLRAWQNHRTNIDDAIASHSDTSTLNQEIGPLTQIFMEKAFELGNVDEMVANDSKYHRLIEVLKDWFRNNRNDKIVLFSTYRETLNYLSERLTADGISNILMHGGVKISKDDIVNQFRDDAEIQVLLSSEVGSEGIDLQFSRILINYDLPWNPMRIEQRIGRLDRIGQKAKSIRIWNLLYKNTIDARIYERLYEKLDLCKKAMGDFEGILGEEINKLTQDLLSDHLTPQEQERRIDQTAQALANIKSEGERLEQEAGNFAAYSDYILKQVNAVKDMKRWIKGYDLKTYVIDFFRKHYPGCKFLQSKEGSSQYDISLTTQAQYDLTKFMKDNPSGTSTRLDKISNRAVHCDFKNVAASIGQSHQEIISQFHPLVRFVNCKITEGEEQLTPAISVQISKSQAHIPISCGNYILVVTKWFFEGITASEKLAYSARLLSGRCNILGRNEAEQLAMACTVHGTDWYEGKRVIDTDSAAQYADDLLAGLDDEFKLYYEDICRQNEDRADLQLRNLDHFIEGKRRTLRGVIDIHWLHDRKGLARATEAKLKRIEEQVECQKRDIEEKRGVRYRNEEIIIAIVLVKK